MNFSALFLSGAVEDEHLTAGPTSLGVGNVLDIGLKTFSEKRFGKALFIRMTMPWRETTGARCQD